jgi:hypothetical protein
MSVTTPIGTVADRVSRWSGSLGVTLPADLVKAIEVFEAIRWTEVGHRPQIDLSKVTAKNVEILIRDHASHLALLDKPGEGWGELTTAKKAYADAAAREVVRLASGAVDGVIEQLTPGFDEAATAYVAAVDLLPEDLSSENLVKAGAAAVGAYGQAQDAAAKLTTVHGWASSLRELPSHHADVERAGLYIIRPANILQLIELDKASDAKVNDVQRAVGGTVLLLAAREGYEFSIRTPREAAQLRASLNTVVGV